MCYTIGYALVVVTAAEVMIKLNMMLLMTEILDR